MDNEWLDQIQDEFDHTYFLRKSGIGWLYMIPNGRWCGPWCCAQIPRKKYRRRYRNNLKRWFRATRKRRQGKTPKHKTLRDHRKDYQ